MNDVEGDRAYVSSLAVLDVRRGSRSQSDPIETSRVLCAAYVCGSPPEVSSRQYGTVRRSTHAYTVNPTRNAVEYPLEALRPGACRAAGRGPDTERPAGCARTLGARGCTPLTICR